jgi:hypothetical protein
MLKSGMSCGYILYDKILSCLLGALGPFFYFGPVAYHSLLETDQFPEF